MNKAVRYMLKVIVQKWWVCAILGVLATLLIVLFMGRGQDVWFDESYSIVLAQQPFDKLLNLTAVDAHPPLYYVLLKVWGELFGWSELALRGLSALLAALTVGVVIVLIRKLFTPRVALASLPFIVLAPFWIRYGYEIRMYALAGLIAALATLVLVSAIRKNNGRLWILYTVLVAAGMYTLYMTVVIWLAHAVWLFIYHRKNFWRQRWVQAMGLAVLLFLPYLGTFADQFIHSALPGIGKVLNITQLGGVASMLFTYTPEWNMGKWSALGLIAVIALTIYLVDRTRRKMSPSIRRSFVLILCLALVPLLFYIFMGLVMMQPFFIPRYMAHVSLFIYAFIGVVAALGWRYGYRSAAGALFALTLALVVWGNVQLFSQGNFNFERMYKPEATKLRQMVDCQKSTVLAGDPYMFMDMQYYFAGCKMYFYSRYPLEYHGGYAWLSDGSRQIKSSDDVAFQHFVHIYWQDAQDVFKPDSRYRLISSEILGKQVVNTYELISE